MRAGGYAMNQSLTSEAANVVKQAVTLARRRGHTQVTPLHVASTMLTSPTGLLRTACLRSNSNPFRCRALELCFNVALNRLPASSAGPMLGPNSHHPSISNALVAAFKRAQAHQRRGSIENQQQPLLAVKIELDQLIISILDDPSVSRVMREAGFSSTQVKADVEKAVALELSSQTIPTDNNSKESNFQVGKGISRPRASSDNQVRNEDVMSVIETMLSKKRKSIVLVGECLATIEGVVRGVMDKVDRGEVPEAFRELKFISLPLNTLENVPREEVERRLGELRCLVKSCVDKGIVFYLEDLHWTTEYRAGSGEQRRKYYCPVEYMIIELGRLVSGIEENGRFWLLGIATFETYRRCKTGHPSLETIWGLHPLTIPEGSLSLSLNPDSSDAQSVSRTKKAENRSSLLLLGGNEKQLSSCLAQCSTKFENEARSFNTCTSEATTSSLPLWLQKYKDENQRLRNTTDQVSSNNDQESVPVRDLCEKWNSFCSSSAQRQPYLSERTITFSSASPSCSTSAISYPNFHHAIHWGGDQHFSTYEEGMNGSYEPSFRIYSPQPKRLFLSNPSSTHNSASSSDTEAENPHRFKEMNSENFKTLCNALEKEVPWHKEIIPEITSTILRCRSGMVRRKGDHTKSSCEAKEETWLFFQGLDVDAKERIARELARLVFGSHSDLVSITLSSFSSTRADSVEDLRNKRSRDEQSCSYLERFAEAVSVNPHRVFLVEDVEQADYCSQMGIKRAIERGRIMSNSNGKEVSLHDAIVILSCESFSSRSTACSPPSKQKSDGSEEEKEIGHCVSLDLNVSFDQDDNLQDNQSIDDIGLLDSVDGRILFKLQDL